MPPEGFEPAIPASELPPESAFILLVYVVYGDLEIVRIGYKATMRSHVLKEVSKNKTYESK